MEKKDIAHIHRILLKNKQRYTDYNAFRKRVFSELSPKESEVILYLLPWLLSVNDPACPGFVPDMSTSFAVYGIQTEQTITKREEGFKKLFGVKKSGSLLEPTVRHPIIQGLYTIGSTGTISQTSLSDCDIWVCFDGIDFKDTALGHLKQKVKQIKKWLNANLDIPVFFFTSDIADIRANRFGSVDSESSGSAQQYVLKEEFYRTCILICGKIPLWWVSNQIDYTDALAFLSDGELRDADLVDLGNLEMIKKTEYFGSALWQFNKSFVFPVKSIIKMALLKMLLDAPQDHLICHRFRESIFTKRPDQPFPDSSLFTAGMIFTYFNRAGHGRLLELLKGCFYLKCKIKEEDETQVLKNVLARAFFKRYTIGRENEKTLAAYASWPCEKQIAFGKKVFRYLLGLYNDIASSHGYIVSESDRKDLTILGRKISSCHTRKKNKIPIIQQPGGQLNIPWLNLTLKNRIWRAFAGNELITPLTSSSDIVVILSFLVWNGLFDIDRIRMWPNPSNIDIQEIKNLGSRIDRFFGAYKKLNIPIENYLKRESTTKALIFFGFDRYSWTRLKADHGVITMNCWGELFVRRFNSPELFQNYLKTEWRNNQNIRMSKYIKNNWATDPISIRPTKAIAAPPMGQ